MSSCYEFLLLGDKSLFSRASTKKPCRIFLQYSSIATMCGSPKFARACGRVSIGRHPDKRPDSRLRFESYEPHYVIGSRRRNRRTPRSTGDAA
jgi:hypothetical protein